MKRLRKYRPSPATLIALAALAVALGGVGYAAIPDSNGVIHACYIDRYSRTHPTFRVIDTERGDECTSREVALSWNQQGPPGPPGPGASQTELVRLSLGETKTVLTKEGFTFTAKCFGTDTFFTSSLLVRSEENGWVAGSGSPHPAGEDVSILQISNNGELWSGNRAQSLIAPSGVAVVAQLGVGVHTFGSDCAAFVMIIGSSQPNGS